MRWLVWALLLCGMACLSQQPRAQYNSFPPGVFTGRAALDAPASASYSGPGDTVSGAKAFWSCARSYSAAYATGSNNACLLVDSATGMTTFTMKILSTGLADVAGASASAACATACKVKTMYDQSGALACAGSTACDMTQATLADMPKLQFSALNSLTCPLFGSGGALWLVAANTLTLAQPMTNSFVAESTSNGGTQVFITDSSGVEVGASFSAATNQVFQYTGNSVATATAATSSFHAMQFNANNSGATSDIYVDGTQTTGSLGSGSGYSSSTISLGAFSAGSNALVGTICEGGIWGLDFSASGRQAAMNTNQHGSNGYNF